MNPRDWHRPMDMLTPERQERIEAVASRRQTGAVVLEDVHDPHNAAAVFRSCEAFGIQTVHLVFVHQAPWDPRRIGRESSSSANKWLTFHVHASMEACLNELHGEGFESIATVIRGEDQTLYEARFGSDRPAFLIGNEHRGLSNVAIQGARRRISIPMRGMVESLNLSVTASILLFELTRQRRGTDRESLDDAEARRIREELLKRS